MGAGDRIDSSAGKSTEVRTMPADIGTLLREARSGNDQALNALFDVCRSYLMVLARAQIPW